MDGRISRAPQFVHLSLTVAVLYRSARRSLPATLEVATLWALRALRRPQDWPLEDLNGM